ncbi:protein transport protein S31 [Coemansia thaxteri]|uniref:Protein transport protein SEC31 n=1 Tax=Coemansia thaxteri TaxID=2663907 RepID=A0A9W8BJ11_9FUNG|nr:protein transport protein S31 [Coemansia thaxteri]KAJ2487742.1 protein transport protein S31 [Coemansia sp. RSA 2320]
MVYQFIDRTAIPAWGPQLHAHPLIAAGTVAGAMDASFSNTSELEIFRLAADDNEADNDAAPAAAAAAAAATSLLPIGKVEANARFQRLAWSSKAADSSDSSSLGMLAGGLENGDITVWDPRKIIDDDVASAVLHSSSAHTGPVCGLEFNPFAPNLMASGATNGEVFIWDIVSEFKSYSPGPRSQRIENVTDLSWNNQVQHILATASSTGSLVVWDLRSRREVIALNSAGVIGGGPGSGAGAGASSSGGRSAGVAAAVWNPQSATQLVTASSDDSNPVIMLWDLRNANAPSQTFAGHHRGILSLSWCRKDAGLLLSSGKDNRTVCWNPLTGDIVGELPPSSNWVYDVQWNQANPNLLSGASFDGRISLFSLTRESTSNDPSSAASSSVHHLVSDDPFAPQASSAFAPSLSLKRPPKWLARPCGAAFGFGGQLVHFNNSASGKHEALVNISDFVSEPELTQQAQQLEDLLQNDQAAELCRERLAQSAGSDQERSWQVLQILFESDARDKLIRFLGFDKAEVKARIEELVQSKQAAQTTEKQAEVKETAPEAVDDKEVEEDTSAEDGAGDNPFARSTSLDADADDFFSKPIAADDTATADTAISSAVAATSAADADIRALQIAFSGAFHIYDKAKDICSEDANGLITRAVLLGDIEAAVELCIEQELFADALILATCGSAELAARAQQAYFAKRAQQAPYVRLLHSIVTGDLTDVVKNADLSEWDEVLALLCTYAQGDQFSSLCETLGRRLEATQQLGNAVTCYLASGNLDKVAGIWIAHQRMAEPGYARIKSLHSLIEKVSVFRKAVQFVDPLVNSDQVSSGGPMVVVLAPLYNCYVEYAQFLVSQGLTDIAARYLQRVPGSYRCVSPSGEDALAALRNRLAITVETPWASAPVSGEQEQAAAQPAQPAQPVQTRQAQQPYVSGYTPMAAAPNAYAGGAAYPPAGASMMPAAQHYSSAPGSNAAAAYPAGFASMAHAGYGSGMVPGGGAFQPPPPPPVNPATIPTGRTPPPRREEVPWNDPPPMMAKAAKRPSHAAAGAKPAAIVSPFPQGRDTPPPPPAAGAMAGVRSPLQPPPMGVAAQSKPLPPPPPPHGPPQPGMHFPTAQQHQQQQMQNMQQQMQPGFVPPPMTMQPPQPYQPQQMQQMQQAMPPQSMRGQVVSASAGAATLAARTATPSFIGGGAAVATAAAVAASAAAAAASASSPGKTAPKYPAGDRSHMPEAWKPVVAGLSAQLARAKQFAAPGQKRMVEDAESRINTLFDLMNCDQVRLKDRLVPAFDQLVHVVDARQFQKALSLLAEIMALNPDITTNVVGVKHLVNVVKTLPM